MEIDTTRHKPINLRKSGEKTYKMVVENIS